MIKKIICKLGEHEWTEICDLKSVHFVENLVKTNADAPISHNFIKCKNFCNFCGECKTYEKLFFENDEIYANTPKN